MRCFGQDGVERTLLGRRRAAERQIDALRNRDYVGFARIYNGPGQPDFYGGLIKGVVDGFGVLG